MCFRIVVLAATCGWLMSSDALGQSQPTCPKGFQPYANRCVSQRMADYISCVEASGGNSERIATEVTNAKAGSTGVDLKGSGSGMVVKGSGSVTVDRATEQTLASKFEQTWTSTGMEECRKVLGSRSAQPKTPSSPKPSTEPLATGASGRLSEFRQSGDDALRQNKIDDARAFYKAATCLNEQNARTEKELESLAPANDKYVYSLRIVGGQLRDRREFQCAERLFREALNYASPDPEQTHYLLGLAFVDESKIDEAINEFTQSEKLLPVPEPSCAFGGIHTWLGYLHRGLAWALRSKGRYDDALTEFNKARPCLGPSEWVPTNINEVKSGRPETLN
jgi:hypothetical protein